MKSLLILLSHICIGLSGLTAQSVIQSVIASDGGTGQGGGVRIDYTLGEVAVERLTGQPVSMTEGFQQPFLQIEKIDVSSSSPDQPKPDEAEFMVSLTPNPVAAELTVKFSQQPTMAIVLDVRDANGIHVLQMQYDPSIRDTPIDMSGFLPGIYYFHFTSADQQVASTYKIVKIQ